MYFIQKFRFYFQLDVWYFCDRYNDGAHNLRISEITYKRFLSFDNPNLSIGAALNVKMINKVSVVLDVSFTY